VIARYIAAALVTLACLPAFAADADPCSGFTWNVTRELTLMSGTAKPVAAVGNPGASVPLLALEKPYALTLLPQPDVKFVVPPGKAVVAEGSHGGLVRFRIPAAGRYRVSITSGHWIDVVQGDHLVKSGDFQRSPGCERPHKIVEFAMPAGNLILQLSGRTDAHVTLAITSVAGSPSS
jgi:hypothetical protein